MNNASVDVELYVRRGNYFFPLASKILKTVLLLCKKSTMMLRDVCAINSYSYIMIVYYYYYYLYTTMV